MLDPFPPPPPLLARLAEPLAAKLHLPTLPLHIHEILLGFLSYHIINTSLAPWLSSRLLPSVYPQFPRRTKLTWNVRVVSLVQSTFICSAALWVHWHDDERRQMDWRARIWGYTGAIGMLQGFAAGYFLWDLMVSSTDFETLGIGSLVHAISALVVSSIGFRPFSNYYGSNFILYELSSPFLNIHWFFDKLHMTGSRAQLYNGIALLVTFFGCRLVWGTYQTVLIYRDMWAAMHTPGAVGVNSTAPFPGRSLDPGAEVMRFAGDQTMPLWLACTYLGSNTLLSCLNFYWFALMVRAVRKRFQPPKEKSVPPKE
ncbi:MAG: hypothetical protein M1832_001375 [Thelocarpon impressellum]|nr:MAG: hypothetical protein M1832_001375 [Thelocarpon impressellum]